MKWLKFLDFLDLLLHEGLPPQAATSGHVYRNRGANTQWLPQKLPKNVQNCGKS
jgi:hypothetical protein